MSEDLVYALIIGGAVAIFSVYIMRSAFVQQADFRRRDKHVKALARHRVGLAPTEEQAQQISQILSDAGQDVSPEQVDTMAYDDEETWVLYAYQSRSDEVVEGALIATRDGSGMNIGHYGVASPDDEPQVAARLASALAIEAKEASVTGRPTFSGPAMAHEATLSPLITSALQKDDN